MPRTIICTTGISIAQGVGPYRGDVSLEEYRQKIRNRLRQLQTELPKLQDFLVRASAESNSLVRMDAGPQDAVHLIHSETDDGRVCAEELSAMIKKELTQNVTLHRIYGLQVYDPQRFRRVGVQNLFSTLNTICARDLDNPDASILLNAAGGYKSVVPYQTLFGLLYRIPVTYIFEQSPAMITLPPAPINFDYERLSQALDALNQLQDQGVMPKAAFFEAIPGVAYHDRDWFESLLEEEDGQVTLSAFGSLLYEALAKSQATVFLSPAAARSLDASQGNAREQLLFMLSRVSDPLWRQGKRHAFQGTDLVVYKPGNTAQRMACIVKGASIYVCELFASHDEYERKLPGKKAADYNTNDFSTWSLSEEEPEPASSEEEVVRRLRAQQDTHLQEIAENEQMIRGLDRELDATRHQLSEAQRQFQTESEKASGLRQQLDQARLDLSSQQDRFGQLEHELSGLQNELQRLRTPWWQRLFRKESP
jgi:putative CRISPR-associated protein (TIGR02619 family)